MTTRLRLSQFGAHWYPHHNERPLPGGPIAGCSMPCTASIFRRCCAGALVRGTRGCWPGRSACSVPRKYV